MSGYSEKQRIIDYVYKTFRPPTYNELKSLTLREICNKYKIITWLKDEIKEKESLSRIAKKYIK